MRSHCWRDTRLANLFGIHCQFHEDVRANLLKGFEEGIYLSANAIKGLCGPSPSQAWIDEIAAVDIDRALTGTQRPTALPTGGIGAKPAPTPWYDGVDLDRLVDSFDIVERSQDGAVTVAYPPVPDANREFLDCLMDSARKRLDHEAASPADGSTPWYADPASAADLDRLLSHFDVAYSPVPGEGDETVILTSTPRDPKTFRAERLGNWTVEEPTPCQHPNRRTFREIHGSCVKCLDCGALLSRIGEDY